MKRSVLWGAVCAVWLLLPAPGAAQAVTEGVLLGLRLNGSSISVENEDQTDSGPGVSGIIGYGFTPAVAAYIKATGASMQPDEGDSYGLGHFDIGVRFSFNGGGSMWVPYANAAYGGRAASFDLGGETLDVSGTAFTVGGGLQYFFNRGAAVDVGLNMSFGDFTEAEVAGSTADIEINATTARFDLGISWYPSGS